MLQDSDPESLPGEQKPRSAISSGKHGHGHHPVATREFHNSREQMPPRPAHSPKSRDGSSSSISSNRSASSSSNFRPTSHTSAYSNNIQYYDRNPQRSSDLSSGHGYARPDSYRSQYNHSKQYSRPHQYSGQSKVIRNSNSHAQHSSHRRRKNSSSSSKSPKDSQKEPKASSSNRTGHAAR